MKILDIISKSCSERLWEGERHSICKFRRTVTMYESDMQMGYYVMKASVRVISQRMHGIGVKE